jgi:predicted nucleic acid-binding protein
MREYVLDANAVLRYIEGQPGCDKVNYLLQEAKQGRVRLAMSVINFGEVFYMLLRKRSLADANKILGALRHVLAEVVVADEDQTLRAAQIKHHYKLAYADSFAAAAALRKKAALVTADPDFEKVGKALKLVRLPQHLV